MRVAPRAQAMDTVLRATAATPGTTPVPRRNSTGRPVPVEGSAPVANVLMAFAVSLLVTVPVRPVFNPRLVAVMVSVARFALAMTTITSAQIARAVAIYGRPTVHRRVVTAHVAVRPRRHAAFISAIPPPALVGRHVREIRIASRRHLFVSVGSVRPTEHLLLLI